jgi:IS4 transposase
MLDAVFHRFVDQSPVTVMVGGLLERVLTPEKLDAWFEQTAEEQYTRELLFSTVFDLMSQVVCGIRPSMHAAYQAKISEVGVSIKSVYNKLNGIEATTSSALVGYSAALLDPIIAQLDGTLPPAIPGYRLKIVDGNCLSATQHRLSELRVLSSGALPGKSLVVYDPAQQTAIDAICCEDGHVQERALFDHLLELVESDDVWMGDRSFCTRAFLSGIEARSAYFIIRHHQGLPWKEISFLIEQGRIETGVVYEQSVRITDQEDISHPWRRIVLQLDQPTRDGDTEIVILSNLPKGAATAKQIARLYRQRWSIEHAFQELTEHLNSEINTLGYPSAALFAFALAVVAYNILAVVKAALRSVHGIEKIEQEFSGYYLADEIAATYRGMMIAIPPEQWAIFRQWTIPELVPMLLQLAGKVDLRHFKKHPRGPKKPRPKREKDETKPHVSTARILAKRKNAKNKP